MGLEYHGTGGWHVTAYATPEGRLGFVNNAHGVAVTTAIELRDELVEAVTVPDQSAGMQASGAAAWTSPDAGVAELVEDTDGVMRLAKPAQMPGVPDGWIQLLVDVRSGVGSPPEVTLGAVRARVVMWGLRTCYGHAGRPGYTSLAADARLSPADWPATYEIQTAMCAIGAPWLRETAQRVAALAGRGDEVTAALNTGDMAGAIKATGAYAWHPFAYDVANAVRSSVDSTRNITLDALRSCGVDRISAACDVSETGGYDLIGYALQSAIVMRLAPVAEAIWAQMSPLVPDRGDGHTLYMRVQSVLSGLAAELAKDLLRGIDAAETEQAIVAAYYADGPVAVDIPVTSEVAS